MMNVNDLDERDDTNDSSVGTPGDGMDGRATMVPPSGLNYVSSARWVGYPKFGFCMLHGVVVMAMCSTRTPF